MHFLFTLHIPFAGEHLERTSHQGGKGRLGMLWISPEGDQEKASTNGDALTGTLERCQSMLRREQLHDVRDNDRVMPVGNRVLEEISLLKSS
jgi:hypothetical protein